MSRQSICDFWLCTGWIYSSHSQPDGVHACSTTNIFQGSRKQAAYNSLFFPWRLSFYAFGSTYIRIEKTKWEILISLNRALSSHVNLCSHRGWWWNILNREKGNFPCDLRPSKIFQQSICQIYCKSFSQKIVRFCWEWKTLMNKSVRRESRDESFMKNETI